MSEEGLERIENQLGQVLVNISPLPPLKQTQFLALTDRQFCQKFLTRRQFAFTTFHCSRV